MSKYYRVRNQREWDWLMKWFEEQDENIKWSYNDKPTGGISDLLVGILLKRADIVVKLDNFTLRVGNVRNREVIGKKLIEVSQMMEGEKMKDYVTINSEDLEKIRWGTQYGAFGFIDHDEDGDRHVYEQYLPAELQIPKSLLYPKVKFTPAEKAEFDKLDKADTLHDALEDIQSGVYNNLRRRLYNHCDDTFIKEQEAEFARAWADPDLIEVLPEKKWNVRVPISNDEEFYKKDSTGKVGTVSFVEEHSLKLSDMQFTAEELKHYGLDNDLFEKVEVSE